MASSTPMPLQMTSEMSGPEIMGEAALQMTSEINGSGIMGEAQESDPALVITRNLLLMAINSINYIRGIFHEDYFSDMSVPALEMKTKMLMPMDAQSRKLIDWMEKGACDALQKKYLKTFVFCIYEEDLILEEYAFSFSYSKTNIEEVVMSMSYTGIKKGRTTFTLNSSQATHQMRSSACKMIRRLISLMRTWDPMSDERTILMKLLYYNDITVSKSFCCVYLFVHIDARELLMLIIFSFSCHK